MEDAKYLPEWLRDEFESMCSDGGYDEGADILQDMYERTIDDLENDKDEILATCESGESFGGQLAGEQSAFNTDADRLLAIGEAIRKRADARQAEALIAANVQQAP